MLVLQVEIAREARIDLGIVELAAQAGDGEEAAEDAARMTRPRTIEALSFIVSPLRSTEIIALHLAPRRRPRKRAPQDNGLPAV
jgi:hypothetical protein